jgi:malic enzyme
VFDIEVDTQEVDEFVQTVKNIAPTFGGINLEDISAKSNVAMPAAPAPKQVSIAFSGVFP